MSQRKHQTKKCKNISAFLQKTYQMIEENTNSSIIEWSPNQIGFIILNQKILTKKLLPKYFKHSNYSSFIRQLNMYDFHKIRKGNIQNYFYHDKFIKNNIQSISEIKRKPQKKKMTILKKQYNKIQNEQNKNNKVNKIQQTLNFISSKNTIKFRRQSQQNIIRQSQLLFNSDYQYEQEQQQRHHNINLSKLSLNYNCKQVQSQEQQIQDSNNSSKMSIKINNNQNQIINVNSYEEVFFNQNYSKQNIKDFIIPSNNNIFYQHRPFININLNLINRSNNPYTNYTMYLS